MHEASQWRMISWKSPTPHRRTEAVKKGRIIGVWFSVALAILVSSGWVGSKLGARIAVSWYRYQQQKLATRGSGERAHLESMLSELDTIETLQFYAVITQNDKNLRKKYLLNDIRTLEDIRRQDLQEIKPVIDFNLAVAYVGAAMAEEQDNNKELATKYMNSAQTLFQSLGWHGYSEETLRILAQRELNKWSAPPHTKEHRK
jgi:hypothetical protein